MKRLLLAIAVALAAIASLQVSAPKVSADPVDCSLVRCMECPVGYHLAPTGNDCCRCVRN
jgi:hypothetical protein